MIKQSYHPEYCNSKNELETYGEGQTERKSSKEKQIGLKFLMFLKEVWEKCEKSIN